MIPRTEREGGSRKGEGEEREERREGRVALVSSVLHAVLLEYKGGGCSLDEKPD